MAKLSREEHAKRVAEKVEAAQAVLAAEITSLVTGDDWRGYLDLAARLHSYSPNNVMLATASTLRRTGRVGSRPPSRR